MSDTLGLNLSASPPADVQPVPPPMPGPVVTLALIAANALTYIVMCLFGVSPFEATAQQVLPWGANFGPLTLSGQWWRLLTACFLHFGILHIGMNMFVLFRVGCFTELLFGRLRFLLLYLLAGIAGNVAGLYVHPFGVGAGASGAVFGVYGGLVGFLLLQRGIVPKPTVVAIVKSSSIFIGINMVYSLAGPQTDLAAHVGGLVTGFAIGALWAQSPKTTPLPEHAIRTVAVTLGAVLVAVAACARVPKISPSRAEWSRQIMTAPSVTVGNQDKVIYTGTATQADAQAVGKMFVSLGIFSKPQMVVLFHKEAGANSISIPFNANEEQFKESQAQPTTVDTLTSKLVDGKTIVYHTQEPRPAHAPLPWDDPAIVGLFKMIGPQVASVAGGAPLTFRLLNGTGDLRNEVRFDGAEVVVGTLDTVTYSGNATQQDARALGSALQASGFFKDRGVTVALARSGDRPEVSFYVKDGAEDNPRIVAGFTALGRKVAPAVGGLPLTVHLVDNTRQTAKNLDLK